MYEAGQYQEILDQLSTSQGQGSTQYMEAVKQRAVIYNSSIVRIDSAEHFIKDMVNNDLIKMS
tara:strand:+ start:2699 stop:2887 length:189 start_codon:yes stop_codon:yes gene_type:complete